MKTRKIKDDKAKSNIFFSFSFCFSTLAYTHVHMYVYILWKHVSMYICIMSRCTYNALQLCIYIDNYVNTFSKISDKTVNNNK